MSDDVKVCEVTSQIKHKTSVANVTPPRPFFVQLLISPLLIFFANERRSEKLIMKWLAKSKVSGIFHRPISETQ